MFRFIKYKIRFMNYFANSIVLLINNCNSVYYDIIGSFGEEKKKSDQALVIPRKFISQAKFSLNIMVITIQNVKRH